MSKRTKIPILTVPERHLLHKYYKFYKALDSGSLLPTTEAQKHFVKVSHNKAKPQNYHEAAYIKCKVLMACSKLREKDIKKFNYGHHKDDLPGIRERLIINPIFFERMPLPDETCAFCLESEYKRAALLFDRVFMPASVVEKDQTIPSEIACCCDRYEWNAMDVAMQVAYEEEFNKIVKRRKIDLDKIDEEELEDLADKIYSSDNFNQIVEKEYPSCLLMQFDYPASVKFTPTPVLCGENQYDTLFPTGNHKIYVAALNNIPIISENEVSWENIMEFKCDKKALKKYSALRSWLNYGLVADSVAQATDIIAKKIDDYQWAIKKFGLKTVNGYVRFIISSNNLLPVVTAGGIAALMTGKPCEALLGGGLIITANTCAWFAEKLIDFQDIKRGDNSEIAILYEIKKKFSSKSSCRNIT